MDRRLIERRESYKKDLAAALERITRQLSSRPEIHKVILFGSYTHKQHDLFTDLDLIVIMDSDLDYITRTAELYTSLDIGVDMDLLVYTPAEFDKMRWKPFIRQALVHGKVLYEKEFK